MAPIQEGSGNTPQQAFVQWNDPKGNKLCSINRDGTMTAQGFVYPPGASSPGAKQSAMASHVLTADDLVKGYFSVPITWPYPFADSNYTVTFGLDDEWPGITIDYAVGDEHFITPSGFIAVVICLGQVPIVQGAYDNFDTNTTESPAFTPDVSTAYQVSLYLHPKTSENSGNFSGDALQASVSYTAEAGENLTLTPSSGWSVTAQDGPNSLSPIIYAAAGYPITVNTVFTTYQITGTSANNWGGLPDTVFQHNTLAEATLLNQPTNGVGSQMYITDIHGGSGAGPGGCNSTDIWESNNYSGQFTPSGVDAMPTLDPFHYHMSLRIVQLPNTPSQVGSIVIISAVAVHN
jgi:hypothetical protein